MTPASKKRRTETPEKTAVQTSESKINAGSSGMEISEEKLIMELLASMGVVKYEPAVVNHLVECMHRFCEEVLTDAHDYAHHRGFKATEIEDLRLALHIREQTLNLPSRDVMMDLAQEVNSKPFPPIVGSAGLRLPPPEFQLTNRPFRITQTREEIDPNVSSFVNFNNEDSAVARKSPTPRRQGKKGSGKQIHLLIRSNNKDTKDTKVDTNGQE